MLFDIFPSGLATDNFLGDGFAHEREMRTFVSNVLRVSGMVDFETEASFDRLVAEAFGRADADRDGFVTTEEAVGAQEDLQLMMGTFMANHLPL